MSHQEHSVKRAYDRESNILIVDDDSTLLKFFKIHLNKFFSRVVVVENGKEALETLKDRPIDLVLSDVRMPKIDGLALLGRIHKSHPDIPVLLISGEPMSDEQTEIINSADGFMAKPFTVDELNEYICGGIDLRNAMKELMPHLKDPKKIRDAVKTNAKGLEKFIKADAKTASIEAHKKIKSLIKKAG